MSFNREEVEHDIKAALAEDPDHVMALLRLLEVATEHLRLNGEPELSSLVDDAACEVTKRWEATQEPEDDRDWPKLKLQYREYRI